MFKLFFYIIRWQLSTPILYICTSKIPFDDITNVIIANLIGAIIFYPLDNLIFKIKKRRENGRQDKE